MSARLEANLAMRNCDETCEVGDLISVNDVRALVGSVGLNEEPKVF